MFGTLRVKIGLGGCLLLASVLPAGAAPHTLAGRLDTETMTGRLVVSPDEHVLTTREGWAVDEVLAAGPDQVVVLWASLPQRNYLRPELWRQAAGGAHRVWPAAGTDVHWYRAEARVRRQGAGAELLVRRALVGENFDAPLLFERRVLRLEGDALVLAGRRTEKVLTPEQRLNEVAALVADGDQERARQVSLSFTEPEYQTRATVLLAGAGSKPGASKLRAELVRRAGRPDAAGRVAAEALLRWKLREAQNAPK